MGNQIAQLAAQSGYEVSMRDDEGYKALAEVLEKESKVDD